MAYARSKSVASYLNEVKVPVLLGQGQADTLFTLQEAGHHHPAQPGDRTGAGTRRDQPVTIELPALVHRVPAGHRIALTLATTDAAYRNSAVPAAVTVAAGAGQTLSLPTSGTTTVPTVAAPAAPAAPSNAPTVPAAASPVAAAPQAGGSAGVAAQAGLPPLAATSAAAITQRRWWPPGVPWCWWVASSSPRSPAGGGDRTEAAVRATLALKPG